MDTRPRVALALTIGAAAIALLSGCGTGDGGDTGSRSTLQYVPTTSYSLRAPATTTTTTTVPESAATEPGGTVPTEQAYTVQAGDGLFKIANLYGVEMDVICEYNGWPDCVDPPHYLFEGDTVLIPAGSKAAGSGQTETAGSTDGGTGTTDGSADAETDTSGDEGSEGIACEHKVVANDNPTRVARKYDVTVDELSNANLGNPAWNHFQLGSTIYIPANGSC